MSEAEDIHRGTALINVFNQRSSTAAARGLRAEKERSPRSEAPESSVVIKDDGTEASVSVSESHGATRIISVSRKIFRARWLWDGPEIKAVITALAQEEWNYFNRRVWSQLDSGVCF